MMDSGLKDELMPVSLRMQPSITQYTYRNQLVDNASRGNNTGQAHE
ncbi:hypothetical protein [Parashewanella spongiae]|nr:hypothetical protein [Parashewanella spongiae]